MKKIIVIYSIVDDYVLNFSEILGINDYEVYSFEKIGKSYNNYGIKRNLRIKLIDDNFFNLSIEELVILKIYCNSERLINKTKELVKFYIKKKTLVIDCNGLLTTKNKNYINLKEYDYSKKYIFENHVSFKSTIVVSNIESQYCQNNVEKLLFGQLNDEKCLFIPSKIIFHKRKNISSFDWGQYKDIPFEKVVWKFCQLIARNSFYKKAIIGVPYNIIPYSNDEIYNGLHKMVFSLLEPRVLILCVPMMGLNSGFFDKVKHEINKNYIVDKIYFVNSNIPYVDTIEEGEIPIVSMTDEVSNRYTNFSNNIDIFNYKEFCRKKATFDKLLGEKYD